MGSLLKWKFCKRITTSCPKEINVGGAWNQWLKLLNLTFPWLSLTFSFHKCWLLNIMLLPRKELVAKLMQCFQPKLQYSFWTKLALHNSYWHWNGDEYWDIFIFWLTLKPTLSSVNWNSLSKYILSFCIKNFKSMRIPWPVILNRS